ncbi:MAG: RIP metalloprotease RseP [Gemmatimonadetes bacterium]|nr:RIP metalloprotease RseP [Gemmatimonadota bacterium]
MSLAWLAPILVLGLVIFVHELGHFLAAKWTGVYAPRFSIGFGPALWKKRRGETEYVLAAFPLGGYVRMASRDDETMAAIEGGRPESQVQGKGAGRGAGEGEARPADWDEEAMVPFGPKPVPEHRWFESKPLWARLTIMLAGVTMNVLLTLVVSTGVFAYYGRAYVPAVVDSVVADMPAKAAGLQKGDSIAAINGQPVKTWSDLLNTVTRSAGKPITLEVVRAGSPLSLTMTPVAQAGADAATGKKVMVGRVGAYPMDRVERDRLGLLEATAAGGQATWAMGTSVIAVVGGLVQGSISVKNLAGPVGIVRTSVAAARTGLESLWALIAFLSINLAVLNLLPIPILDGGQVLMTIAESIKGSPFSVRTRENVMRIGLAAIVALFAVVMFNDIVALFR